MPRSMNDDDRPGDAGENKHATARHLAEAGLRAERAGDQTRADELFDEAERTDPEALANVLMENPAPAAVFRHKGLAMMQVLPA